MADDTSTPSVASHTSVFNNIFNALMHLAGISPSGAGPVEAAVRAAQTEVNSWTPQPDPVAEPDPEHPETEADGDGPPAEPPRSNDLADEPSLDTPTPEHSPAG